MTHTNTLSDIPHYIKIFQSFLGKRVYVVYGLSLFAALAESVGILTLLPLLQELEKNNHTQNHVDPVSDNLINHFVRELTISLGINDSLTSILLLVAFAFVAKAILTFGALGYNAYLRAQLLRKLKSNLFDAYCKMSYDYYSKRDTGYFTNLINEQSTRALDAFRYLNLLAAQLVNSIIYICIAFLVAWRFGVMALTAGILLLLAFKKINAYVRNLSRETATENGYLAQMLIQALQAYKYLIATDQIESLGESVKKSIERLKGFQVQTGIAGSLTSAIREPIIVICVLFIVMLQLVIFEEPLGPIVVSILLFYRGLNSILGMQGSWQNTLEYIGSLELVRDEYKQQVANQECDGNIIASKFKNEIIFENVFFSYNEKSGDVLKEINLRIPHLSSVGFIGHSGSGKSTAVDLITLIVKPRLGMIFIDGVDGAQLSLSSWRRQIGYVSQETIVFDDTIANNICLWQGDVDKDHALLNRIKDAASKANISEFIETLPYGYQTYVGDRGICLSGGQRQRIFIARELFRKPNILILDEATSALDAESEQAIQRSIDDLKGQITIIIVAHRVSTIRNCDQVYVFDNGFVVENGPYSKLRDSSNTYLSRIIAMQAA